MSTTIATTVNTSKPEARQARIKYYRYARELSIARILLILNSKACFLVRMFFLRLEAQARKGQMQKRPKEPNNQDTK